MVILKDETKYCLLFVILATIALSASANQKTQTRVRKIQFKASENSSTVKGTLKPYEHHIYRMHAYEGQQLTVSVESPANESEKEGVDIVFWVQTSRYLPGRNTRVIGGDKGGETQWSGVLPAGCDYEIVVSNPSISSHRFISPTPYTLKVRIE